MATMKTFSPLISTFLLSLVTPGQLHFFFAKSLFATLFLIQCIFLLFSYLIENLFTKTNFLIMRKTLMQMLCRGYFRLISNNHSQN